jgi:hypothetical protein
LGSYAEICFRDMLSYHVFLRIVARWDHFAFAAPDKGGALQNCKSPLFASFASRARACALIFSARLMG